MRKLIQILFLLSTSLIMSSCGYQLRGSINIDGLDQVLIAGSSENEIVRLLQQQLPGSQLVKNTTEEKYPIIRIINIKTSKRQLSVNSSGRADEYEISKNLEYQLILPDGVRQTGNLTANASYDFDESQMQGTKEKEIIANNSIARALTRKLVLRLKSALKASSNQ
jgi:LPS-assembly lipoprotein